MTIVCRQRSIRRKIGPRDQSLLQVRQTKMSQPLQKILRHSLVLIHFGRNVNNNFSQISRVIVPGWAEVGADKKPNNRADHRTFTCVTQPCCDVI